MSSRTENFTVEKSLPSARLDKFLCEKFPAASRGALQRLIEEGHVRVNGQAVKPTHDPRAGEKIEVHWPEAKPAEAQPENIPLDILFEDKSLLVVNKPAGLVVHPAAGHEDHTLVNALLHHCQGSLSGIGGVARPGIVHRLDKETSGCLVVAKNDETHLALSAQFAGRDVKKIYQAIVCGVPTRQSGEIRAAIARHPTQRKRMAVGDDNDGRDAHTSYRILEQLYAATLWRRRSTPAARIRSACISSSSAIPSSAMKLTARGKTRAQGTDELRRAARDAAREKFVLHPSAHGKSR